MAMLTGVLMEADSAAEAERMVCACVAVRMWRSVGWVPMLLVVGVGVDILGGGGGGGGVGGMRWWERRRLYRCVFCEYVRSVIFTWTLNSMYLLQYEGARDLFKHLVQWFDLNLKSTILVKTGHTFTPTYDTFIHATKGRPLHDTSARSQGMWPVVRGILGKPFAKVAPPLQRACSSGQKDRWSRPWKRCKDVKGICFLGRM